MTPATVPVTTRRTRAPRPTSVSRTRAGRQRRPVLRQNETCAGADRRQHLWCLRSCGKPVGKLRLQAFLVRRCACHARRSGNDADPSGPIDSRPASAAAGAGPSMPCSGSSRSSRWSPIRRARSGRWTPPGVGRKSPSSASGSTHLIRNSGAAFSSATARYGFSPILSVVIVAAILASLRRIDGRLGRDSRPVARQGGRQPRRVFRAPGLFRGHVGLPRLLPGCSYRQCRRHRDRRGCWPGRHPPSAAPPGGQGEPTACRSDDD